MSGEPVSASAMVGLNARRLRGPTHLRLSQSELASRCGWGKSKQSDIERGQHTVSVEDLLRLALELGTSPAWLLSPHPDIDASLTVVVSGGSGKELAAVVGSVDRAVAWITGQSPLSGETFAEAWLPKGEDGFFRSAPRHAPPDAVPNDFEDVEFWGGEWMRLSPTRDAARINRLSGLLAEETERLAHLNEIARSWTQKAQGDES
jgi:transcriptional regulator with XRE-family HTH domain